MTNTDKIDVEDFEASMESLRGKIASLAFAIDDRLDGRNPGVATLMELVRTHERMEVVMLLWEVIECAEKKPGMADLLPGFRHALNKFGESLAGRVK